MALSKSLSMDLPALAEMLRSKGRGRDTILAHITPREAALLKKRGGSGTINPDTGLPEFDDFVGDISTPQDVAPVSPTYDVVNQQGQFTPTQAETGVPVQVAQNYTPGGDQYAPSPSATGKTAYDLLGPYGQTTPYGVAQPGQDYPPQTGPATPTLTPASVAPTAANAPTTVDTTQPKPDQGFLSKLGDTLTSQKSLDTLAKLGLTGALGVYGASQARKGAAQTQAATQQQQAIAQPYQSQGQQLVAQAQQGTLTPASQQAYQAAQAQLAQQQANRGGVGAQQAANQLANVYQTLLNNQYTYGLQVMQIGDNISLGAIKSGLQLDQQLNTATTNFYSQLASIVGGTSVNVPYTQSRTS